MYPEAFGYTDIYTIDVDGKNEKRITKTMSLSEMWASFSCDNLSSLLRSIIKQSIFIGNNRITNKSFVN